MLANFIRLGCFILMQWSVGGAFAGEAISPSVSGVPSANTPANPSPAPLSPEEKKKLKSEFKNSLRESERAFDHQERAAQKEFASAQSVRIREWRDREKRARHEYFAIHSKGPEQRKYVLEFVERKKGFDRSVKEANQEQKRIWKEKREAFRSSELLRQKKFDAALELGQRPSPDLWQAP